jgi:hypothetical protein
MDTASRTYRDNPYGVGSYLRRRYSFDDRNHVFLVGVGDDRDVNTAALEEMERDGAVQAIRIEAFGMLELVFMHIALQVATEASVERHTLPVRGAGDAVVPGLTWDQVQARRRVVQRPIDYCFLIDVSGAMNHLTK